MLVKSIRKPGCSLIAASMQASSSNGLSPPIPHHSNYGLLKEKERKKANKEKMLNITAPIVLAAVKSSVEQMCLHMSRLR